MAAQARFVDALPTPEKVDNVQVLAIGLSRTGTMSMFLALKKLGYKSYHMLEACHQTHNGHLTMWEEALRAKFPRSSSDDLAKPYSSSDFHKLLKDYNALSDIPSIHFIPELLAAYPNAQLILTTHPRGVEGWLKSVKNCFYRIASWPVWEWPLMVHDTYFSLPYIGILRRSMELWTGTLWPEAGDYPAVEQRLRAKYAEHNDLMRKYAREQGRPLLEFDPRQGWEPLCEFLGKEVPAEPYPHANEGNYVIYLNYYVVVRRLLSAACGRRSAMVVAGLAAAAVAWRWQ